MTFAIDQDNNFYVGSSNDIFVVSIETAESAASTAINSEDGIDGSDEHMVPVKNRYSCSGRNCRKGHIPLPKGVTLHKIYDSDGSIVAIFEAKQNQLDFYRLRCEFDKRANELKIKM